MTFRLFHDMTELEEWFKTHSFVYYHAPMDHRPVLVNVLRYTVSNTEDKSRNAITVVTTAGDRLIFRMAQHFDRFKMREETK